MYVLNDVDHVFDTSLVSTSAVAPDDTARVSVVFRPRIPNQSYTEYYTVDCSKGNNYRLTVTGSSFGPKVEISKKQVNFTIHKNSNDLRMEVITLVNQSAMDTTYQWLLPLSGRGYFQISTGSCGVIRANESIVASLIFTGSALGLYTAELVCLVLHQEPLFLNVMALVILQGHPTHPIEDHILQTRYRSRSAHYMENSLNRLTHIPAASVCERYLDFGMGSVTDITLNRSQVLCVTNHQDEEGFLQWMPDPENVFIVDPIEMIIPPKECRQFTVRFRPKVPEDVYGYVMFGDYQQKVVSEEDVKYKHSWFRVPCVGNTWSRCTDWPTQCDCPTEIVLPPTVPTRTSFANFSLCNKLETPMHFKFLAPTETNFAIMPMCGIVHSRGWQIITVAMEAKTAGDYNENWDLVINGVQKIRIRLVGAAQACSIAVMSHGYEPAADAMSEFPPTVTGCVHYCCTYIHNLTRMFVHIRVLNHVDWLGADEGGSLILSPREIIPFRWWFFPKTPDMIYSTLTVMTAMCLINNRPVGVPIDYLVKVCGFSEYPELKVLPRTSNLHDVVVGEQASVTITVYNRSACFFTSKLYAEVKGLGDDHTRDRLEIVPAINTLKPSNYVRIKLTVTPNGAGPRQVDIKYKVLCRDENDEIIEIQPITTKIHTLWYDGIYPTFKASLKYALSFNNALEDCRPHKPIDVDIFAPDLCIYSGNVHLIFVLGCVYRVPVAWNLRREKICDCPMVVVQTGISTFEKRHNCVHRDMVELSPLSGIVSVDNPGLIHLKFKYLEKGNHKLCYILTMPNDRTINLYVNIFAHSISKGILTPLRRLADTSEYLTILDCGRVPVNNLDPIVRLAWLYNPTDVFTTWRLLRGNSSDVGIRCMLHFAELAPLGRLAIPFAFFPTEMIDYEVVFSCSFGYDIVQMVVRGQGGLPGCLETRLDLPSYTPQIIRNAWRTDVVHLSKESFVLPTMPTHCLSRDIVAICNDTDFTMRFIWLPERIANIVNIVMTPCWGVLQPRAKEWITMTVYTLQEPATFTLVPTKELFIEAAYPVAD
ncbi:unnamed protein product [Plutella xylostella]|uniref:(diamondback moth) hypothetical protein n=1 Tax=Plutella xylostella TaxID=51655 RepID=A0A8S4EGP1_PLUXY|nr:unnamed protein product [Plutella xylostella]